MCSSDLSRLTIDPLNVPDSTFADYIDEFSVDTNLYTIDSNIITADTTIYSEVNIIGSINTQVNKTFNTYTINGQVINETTYAQAVSNYEYETTINDSRRQIKVIKNRYYDQIMREFRDIVGNIPSYVRTVA